MVNGPLTIGDLFFGGGRGGHKRTVELLFLCFCDILWYRSSEMCPGGVPNLAIGGARGDCQFKVSGAKV